MGGRLTDEQVELRSVVRALLEKESPEAAVRATMDGVLGYAPELWATMAELGLPGLAVPERFGGAGAGWAEQGLVFTELGRALVCAPYLSTVGLAVPTLLASGDEEAAARWLPGVAAGRLLATAALTGPLRRTAADVAVRAERIDGGWRLHGVEPHVLDGAVAELLLVLARAGAGEPVGPSSSESDEDGPAQDGPAGPAGPAGPDRPELADGPGEVSLFAVSDWAAGVTAITPRTSDRTRRVARIELAGADATLVGTAGAGLRIAALARPAAVTALACEQVGGAARVLEMAVEYARTREQFGRPIGSFQAVKHRCADMLVAVETARSAAWAVVRALDGLEVRADLLATIAGAACSQAYARCASDCLQVHGGVGYTWEHPTQLHVKRSRSGTVLFGTPREHRALVAELIPELTDERIRA